MDFERLDNGTFIPAAEERTQFSKELWAMIHDRMFHGRTKIFLAIKGESVLFRLPPPTQILDFVSMRETDDPNIVVLNLELPEDNGDRNICRKITLNISTD